MSNPELKTYDEHVTDIQKELMKDFLIRAEILEKYKKKSILQKIWHRLFKRDNISVRSHLDRMVPIVVHFIMAEQYIREVIKEDPKRYTMWKERIFKKVYTHFQTLQENKNDGENLESNRNPNRK